MFSRLLYLSLIAGFLISALAIPQNQAVPGETQRAPWITQFQDLYFRAIAPQKTRLQEKILFPFVGCAFSKIAGIYLEKKTVLRVPPSIDGVPSLALRLMYTQTTSSCL